MAEITVDVFCEDVGHESFVRALLSRLAEEASAPIRPRFVMARGGAPRALAELKAWQRSRRLGGLASAPDVLVIVIDGNSVGPQKRRQEIERQLDEGACASVVIGCPDPHVERWVLADPEAFGQVVGGAPLPDPGRSGRGVYKKLLQDSLDAADALVLTTAMEEYAPDIVAAMDLYRAGKARPDLGHFVDHLRAALRLAVARSG